MLPTKLLGSELVEEKLGPWPTFHDAEILTMVLDRRGPTLLVRILVGVPIRPPETWTPEAVKAWTHFEVSLRFNDTDSLDLSEFNHQNVISYLALASITEERPSTLATEERVKVEIHSAWGVRGSFTCSGGEVISIEETSLRTGNPGGWPILQTRCPHRAEARRNPGRADPYADIPRSPLLRYTAVLRLPRARVARESDQRHRCLTGLAAS